MPNPTRPNDSPTTLRVGSSALRIAASVVLCALLGGQPVTAATTEALEMTGGAGLRLAWPAGAERPALPTLAAADASPGLTPAADGDQQWRTVPPAQPDWRGAKRDVTHFLSYQIVGVAVLYLMPESVSGWSDEDKKQYSFEKWRYNVTHPHMDSDTFFVNYVLHPYWGGAYYVRARERGLDRIESLWFATLMSALWEYGAEALAEQVSIQDLIATPVLGSLLGEYVFTPLRQYIKSKPGPLDWTDKTLLALTDPFGAINEKVDQWFGLKASVQVSPNAWRQPTGLLAAAGGSDARRRATDGWNLKLRVDW